MGADPDLVQLHRSHISFGWLAGLLMATVAWAPQDGDGWAHDAVIRVVPRDFPTIQEAIAVSTNGDYILVRPGTYHEAINLFGLALRLIATGGPDHTVIDGSGFMASTVTTAFYTAGTARIEGFTITGGTGSLHEGSRYGGGVQVANGAKLRLTDCRIEGNSAIQQYPLFYAGGGGVAVIGSAGSTSHNTAAFLIDCEISDNVTTGRGGGVYQSGLGFLSIENCHIAANTAEGHGGGVSAGSYAVVAGSRIEANRAGERGGGLYGVGLVTGSQVVGNVARFNGGGVVAGTVEDTDVFGNEAGNEGGGGSVSRARRSRFAYNRARRGGGVSVSNCGTVLEQCVFFSNVATESGGGADVTACFNKKVEGDVGIVNCAFVGNEAPTGDGLRIEAYPGIYGGTGCIDIRFSSFHGDAVRANGDLLVDHSVFRGHPNPLFTDDTYVVTWSNVEGGFPGTGNIDVDPLFVDPERGDLHLAPGSPCIDAGDPGVYLGNVPVDLDGEPRLSGVRVDLGADEVPRP